MFSLVYARGDKAVTELDTRRGDTGDMDRDITVSYTHLDVYKRQAAGNFALRSYFLRLEIQGDGINRAVLNAHMANHA